jgi:iron complex transport system ATP-binding protein
MSTMLDLRSVSVRRGARTILEDVSLSVEPGEVLGLIGPNGAGKTTLLRAALGLQKLSGGEARLGGRPLASLGESERAAIAGYLPQERRVAWNMPAREVAALGAAALPPAQGHAIADACLAELEVSALADRGVLDMSGGERARVLLARLLATRAPLLVADEPAAGLDPEAQLLILERLRQRAADGAAVIVTSHDLALAARACDRLAVLHEGRLKALAPPREALSAQVLAEVFALDGALIETPTGLTLAARRRLAQPHSPSVMKQR